MAGIGLLCLALGMYLLFLKNFLPSFGRRLLQHLQCSMQVKIPNQAICVVAEQGGLLGESSASAHTVHTHAKHDMLLQVAAVPEYHLRTQ